MGQIVDEHSSITEGIKMGEELGDRNRGEKSNQAGTGMRGGFES